MSQSTLGRIQHRVHSILAVAEEGDRPSRVFDILILILICLNVVAAVVSTVPNIGARWEREFDAFEVASLFVFTVEYVLRVWSCVANARYKGPIVGRVRFALTPLAVVDLIAILPAYVPMLVGLDLRTLRAIRLVRLMRLMKISRYSQTLATFGRVFRKRRADLLITSFCVLILLLVSASLIYVVEHDAQPGSFSSIPASMWWSVSTLTTVGYGDIYPITPIGKLLGAVVAILGVGLFALPAGILGSGFVEEMRSRDGGATCPHCGKRIES